MNMMDNSGRQREAGIALLIVMIGLSVVGVLALGLVLATKPGMQEASYIVTSSEEASFFDAVLLQTSTSLLATNIADRPRVDGVTELVDVLGMQVPVAVSSEFGKVDLNAADGDTLERFFEAANEGPAEATEEAAQIVSYRNVISGGTNHSLFRTAEEILKISSIRRDIYNKVRSSITVYSGRSEIDQSTASLLALQAAPGMDHLKAAAIIRNRIEEGSDRQAYEVAGGKILPGISITGWSFLIAADFTFGSHLEHAEAVVRMTGDPARPSYILWRQEDPD